MMSQSRCAKVRQRCLSGVALAALHSPDLLSDLLHSQDGVLECMFLNGAEDMHPVRNELYVLMLNALRYGSFEIFQHVVQNFLLTMLTEGIETLEPATDTILKHSL